MSVGGLARESYGKLLWVNERWDQPKGCEMDTSQSSGLGWSGEGGLKRERK